MADKEVRTSVGPRLGVGTRSGAAAHSSGAAYWRPPAPSSAFFGKTCSWLLAAALIALVLFWVMSENGLGEYLRLRGQRETLQQELQTIQTQTDQLEARLEALRTKPFALEKLARERYNMRREGEEVLLLVPEERATASRTPRTTAPPRAQGSLP